MERLTMTNEEIESIRQYCEHFNCPIKAEEDDITNQFCDKMCDEFQDNCPFMKVGLKLKSYEDAEEQGLLLRLPCKVGDTVYCIKARWKDRKGNGGTECYISEETVYHLNYIVENLNKFGKTIFLTKEAAEQALNQMGE